MENLYQRLKEEIVIELDAKKNEFPTLIRKIIIELKDKEYVSDVSYGTFCDLRNFAIGLNFDFNSLYAYFKDQRDEKQ